MPIHLKPGQEVQGDRGRYMVSDAQVAAGGQSLGYHVKDQGGRALFLKMFMEPTGLSAEAEAFRQRQRALLERLARVPDFVCVDVDFFERDHTFYKVSERMEGETLADRLQKAEDSPDPASWPEAERMTNAAVLAYALAEVHEQGLAHLDLKPENCILAERTLRSTGAVRRVARLLDFDGAWVEGAPPPERYLGTPQYWTPEHVNAAAFGLPGQHSDVFTLGIMLYEVLARRYPFEEARDFLSRRAPHPRDVAPWVPAALGEALFACLAPRAADRPTARELHGALLGRSAAGAPARVALVATGRRIRFWKDSVLGRDGLRGLPGYEYVDRVQARILRDGSGFAICHEPGAANATVLNGTPVPSGGRVPLQQGDHLQVGRLRLEVDLEWDAR